MIVRVAVVPHPPLLVPELAAGARAETEPLRAACVRAATWLTEISPCWLALAGGSTGYRRRDCGTFAAYGRDVPACLHPGPCAGPADPYLSLPALVAGWLRGQAAARKVDLRFVSPSGAPSECAASGAGLAGEVDAPAGLLVLADGSNRVGERSPGSMHPRAPAFERDVAAALGAADRDALLALDPGLARELGVSGLAAWQVLAGLPGRWRAEVAYSAAPYGVGYHVARWELV